MCIEGVDKDNVLFVIDGSLYGILDATGYLKYGVMRTLEENCYKIFVIDYLIDYKLLFNLRATTEDVLFIMCRKDNKLDITRIKFLLPFE